MNINQLKNKVKLKKIISESCGIFYKSYKRYPTITELQESLNLGFLEKNDKQISEANIDLVCSILLEAGFGRGGRPSERGREGGRERGEEAAPGRPDVSTPAGRQARDAQLKAAREKAKDQTDIFNQFAERQFQQMLPPDSAKKIRIETGRLSTDDFKTLSVSEMEIYANARLELLKRGKVPEGELTPHDVHLMTKAMEQQLANTAAKPLQIYPKQTELVKLPPSEAPVTPSPSSKQSDIVPADTTIKVKPVSKPTDTTSGDIVVRPKREAEDKRKDMTKIEAEEKPEGKGKKPEGKGEEGKKPEGKEGKGKEGKGSRWRWPFTFGFGGQQPQPEKEISQIPKMTDELAGMEIYGAKARRSFLDPIGGKYYTSEVPVVRHLSETVLSPKESAQRKLKKQKYKVAYIQDGKKIEVFASSIRGIRRIIYGKKQYRIFNSSGSDMTGYFKKLINKKD